MTITTLPNHPLFDDGNFQVFQSEKEGLEGLANRVVTRGSVGYLRILGQEPEWQMMTMTADEDDGEILVCRDVTRLLRAAEAFSRQRGFTPQMAHDHAGRRYVKMCRIKREYEGETLDALLIEAIRQFFKAYDHMELSYTKSDLDDLYAAMVPSEDAGDVYLSDGVWLGADGSLSDRGR